MTRLGRILILASLVLTVQAATAATYQLAPPDDDLQDLDHYWAYEWGFGIDVPKDEVIVDASLFFDNIRNWDDLTNDLWLTLLDSDFEGVQESYDSQDGADYFANKGLLLNHWEDLPSTVQDITYDFNAAEIAQLSTNLTDGQAGLGFDPDSDFYNSGIKFTIQTSRQGGSGDPIPEPLTGPILLGGLGALAARRRRH